MCAVAFIGTSIAKASDSHDNPSSYTKMISVTDCTFSSSAPPPICPTAISVRGGGNVLRTQSCVFQGGHAGVCVSAGGRIEVKDSVFSRHKSVSISVSAMSFAQMSGSSVRESEVGVLADGCGLFVVECGVVDRCRMGKWTSEIDLIVLYSHDGYN